MSLLNRLSRLVKRSPWQPLRFPTEGFQVVSKELPLEEENLDDFVQGLYYPVTIGQVLEQRYQIVGKLGFGRSSTVWLARDMQAREHVTLKVYSQGEGHRIESDLYQKIGQINPKHPGHMHVRSAIRSFTIPHDNGSHICLAQRPMWDSFTNMLFRNPSHRFSEDLLKAGLLQVFRGLDFLHTECELIHTDIKGDNILQEIADPSILEDFVRGDIEYPVPRKFVDGHPVYASRPFGLPKEFGPVVISDFGEAESGIGPRHHNAQPDVYRSPEVMLQADWSYPIDIWNVGAMIWDLFEDRHLFYGIDPERRVYTTRCHLAEIIALLGPPPLDLLQRGRRVSEFFDEEGKFIADVPVPDDTLEDLEENLQGENKKLFLQFVRSMLQWRPQDRKTAKQLLEDPWLNSPTP